jgi:predicted SprT family Zn-dependent metalloprotease
MLAERKQQVLSKVNALIARAQQLYGESCVPHNFTTRFDLRGRTAGQACRANGQYWMRFNVDMMQNESWDHIYHSTIPHELAHIICMHRGWDRGHGAMWRRVCLALGGTAERCHSEQVKYAKGKTYYYTTSTGKVVALSVIRHRKIQMGTSYTLRSGGKIDRTCTYRVA